MGEGAVLSRMEEISAMVGMEAWYMQRMMQQTNLSAAWYYKRLTSLLAPEALLLEWQVSPIQRRASLPPHSPLSPSPLPPSLPGFLSLALSAQKRDRRGPCDQRFPCAGDETHTLM